MNDEIYSGTCIHLPKPGQTTTHLWVVLTEPDNNPQIEVEQPFIVLVNMTTRRDGSDTTVILHPGNHRFIKHETVINYSDAKFVPVKPIQELIKRYNYDFDDDCSEELLESIQKGLLESRFTPKKIKKYCKQVFNFE